MSANLRTSPAAGILREKEGLRNSGLESKVAHGALQAAKLALPEPSLHDLRHSHANMLIALDPPPANAGFGLTSCVHPKRWSRLTSIRPPTLATSAGPLSPACTMSHNACKRSVRNRDGLP